MASIRALWAFPGGAAALLLVSAQALAERYPGGATDGGDGYYVYADVVEVAPRYGWHEISEPVTRCVDAYPRFRDYRQLRADRRDHRGDAAAGLVGGLIGGLIGHQFGGGDGKKALTVVGAVIGSSIAMEHERQRRAGDDRYWDDRYREDGYREHGYWDGRDRRGRYGYQPPARRCTESYQTRRVRGVQDYDVTYRYAGRLFHKRVPDHPGDRIRVHVAVEPLT